MSRVKEDLRRVSLNQLCTLTGKTSRTIKKYLADLTPQEESGILYYNPVDALPLIYGLNSGNKVDPWKEKARYDQLRADKVSLEIEILRENLIPADRVESAWQKIVGIIRSRFLTLPSRVSPRVLGITEPAEVERLLKAEVYDALTELSGYNDGIDRSENIEKRPKAPRSAT